MSEIALSITNANKRFDGVQAVKDLSLEVPAGSIYGLLGPNGAGKTTTIRMILNIIAPDEGEIRFHNQLWHEEMKNQIGYLPEERGLYRKMKVLELLIFLGEIKGVQHSEGKKRALSWLERLELAQWKDKKVEELSKGMQQKLQFISTVLHKPTILILDEPFSGLDPINTDLLKEIVMELRKDRTTVIFSTHQMESAERLCDRIALINRGEKVLDGDLVQIKSRFGTNTVRLEVAGDHNFLSTLTGVQKVDTYPNHAEIQLKPDTSTQAILNAVAQRALIMRFEVVKPSLHQIFLDVVRNHPKVR